MKKIYLQPETEITVVCVEGLLNTLTNTDVENANLDDPNKDKDGPGLDKPTEEPDLSKGWNPWSGFDWDD